MINATINDPTAKNQASNEPTKVGGNPVVVDKSVQTPVGTPASTANPSKAPIFNMPATPPGPVTPTNTVTPTNVGTPPSSNEKTSKPKKKNKFNVKMIAGVFALLLIMVGAGAGFFLSQQSQDIRQQADDTVPYTGNECTIDYHCQGIGSDAKCEDGFCVTNANVNLCIAQGGEWYPDEEVCRYPTGKVAEGARICDIDGISADCGSSCLECSVNLCVPNGTCDTECSPACPAGYDCIETTYEHFRCINPEHIGDCFYCEGQSQEDASQGCPTSDMVGNGGYSTRQDITLAECKSNIPECGGWQFDANEGGDNFFDGGWNWDPSCDVYVPPIDPPDDPPDPSDLDCNDACSTPSQCSDVDSSWFCDPASNKCRLEANPTSTSCDPALIPGEPMCKDVAVLENGIEINPATTTLSIETILQFRCAADDIDGKVTNYEFKITEPDGTVIEGDAINPAGSSATSLEYQIDQYLEHLVQCRVCTTDGCQEYITIAN